MIIGLIKRFTRYFFYIPGILFCFFYIRPKFIIILYGDRFGHFLMNTEIFLSEFQGDINKLTFIILSKKIDSIELKSLFETSINKKIYYGYLAKSLSYYQKLLSIKLIDIRPLTEPNKLPVEPILEKFIPLIKECKPFITLTLRDGRYSSLNQDAPYSTTFRDTPLSTLNKSLEFIKAKGFDIYVINKTLHDISSNCNLIDASNLSLIQRWSIVKSAKFHIGTSTGFDACAFYSKKPCLLLNGSFGPSMNSKYFIDSNIAYFLPLKMFDYVNNRFIKVEEYISFLKHIEKKYEESSIINNNALLDKGLIYIPNSENEIFFAVKEFVDYFENDIQQTDNQKKFWDIYPKKWSNIKENKVVFHDATTYTPGLRISDIFLEQYLK